jgi:alcohol dehydrogenase
MRAVVLQGKGEVSVEEVPDPELPGEDGAIVRVEKTAICGSDLHLYHGSMGGVGVRLGHEFVGPIEEVGSGVRRAKKGDRVLVSGVIGCGRCPECLGRDPVLCSGGMPGKVWGVGPDLHGGQAEAVAVPTVDAFTMTIPEAVTTEQAVLLTDILPTGYLGAQRADITPGDTVVVIGLGPVGVFALQCAQLFGPARILAVDTVPERLARAEALGAEPIDASKGGTPQQVIAATGGRGADAVIEAVGADQTITDAIFSCALGGTISVIGVNLNFQFPLPAPLLLMRRLTLRMTLASVPTTWSALVPLIERGRLHPEDVFTHHLGLSQAAEAYRMFDRREDGCLKVLLDPTS